MHRLEKYTRRILWIILIWYLYPDWTLDQMELDWNFQTQPGRDHIFRGITVNVSEKKMYISDSFQDVVYIYRTNDPAAPVDSISSPYWQDWPGRKSCSG